MTNSPTASDVWHKIFPDRAAKSIVITAAVALLVILNYYFTKIHVTQTQHYAIIFVAIFAIWQAFWRQSIDVLLLLFAYLNFSLVFTYNRFEVMPIWASLLISTATIVILTVWQGHKLFPRSVLWRNAYLVGLVSTEIVTLIMYWVIYDDVLSEALLCTFIIYLFWSLIEADSRGALSLKNIKTDLAISLLLVIFVLVTIKPVLMGSVR